MLKAIVFDWNGTLCDKDTGELYPGARKVVAIAKERHKVALLSRGDPESRKAKVDATGLRFDVLHVVEHKRPEELALLLKELNVAPEETLVVDDYVIRGIQAGNALGCRTCWVRQGKHKDILPDEETGQPTYQIDAIEELLELL